MDTSMIVCPNCCTEITPSEALAGQFRHENEVRLKALAAQAKVMARADMALERQLLEQQLAEERAECQTAKAAELQPRKDKSAVEERARQIDLEVARRVDAETRGLAEAIRRGDAEQQEHKLKEKDKLIADLRRGLDEARRKSEQGLPERQGEVLELDIQTELERRFPQDRVAPVTNGARGADLVHEMRDATLRSCGAIV
jgi:hypothetical protein